MKRPGFPDLSGEEAPADGGRAGLVRVELSLKSLAIVLGLVAGVWLLLSLIPILLVLVAALMTVGALNPIVANLEQRKIRRHYAIGIVFGVGAVGAIVLAIVIIPKLLDQARVLVASEPQIRESVASFLERSQLGASLAEDLRQIRFTEVMKSSGATLLMIGTRTVEIVAYAIGAVFLAFYMMIDGDRLRGALFAVVPRRHHIRLSAILLNLGTIVGGYIRGQLLTCLLMSAFILAVLLACRVPNALALAAFGGVMDLLPYIGIFLTMAPAVLAATLQGPGVGLTVFVLLLAYEELESRVLVPVVYGRALRLPSSVVFFSLILGTTLAGIAGALLALPTAAAVLMLIEELRVELPGEAMQPEDHEQRRKDDRAEQEYERRTESLPAEEAAAIAVEISGERKEAETAAKKTEMDESKKSS